MPLNRAPEGLIPHADLTPYNTLRLPAEAEYLLSVYRTEQLKEALSWARREQLPVQVLGQGSNVVLAPEVPGLVIRIAIPGVDYQQRDESVIVRAGGGVIWSALVDDSLAKGYSGLENLSLIPGTVGAAPIQNIGAYGVELDQLVLRVETIDLEGQAHIFSAQQCGFRYRDSYFKSEWRGEHLVTAVTLKLSTHAKPVLSYAPLAAAFEGQQSPSAEAVAEQVKRIRRSKLPDPAELPNAGSFFKNPVVPESLFHQLQSEFADIPHWPAVDGIKLSAGWLLQQAGWKGRKEGPLGMHSEQALVLVHHGGANGHDIDAFSERLQQDVLHQFGVALEREPATVGRQNR